MNASGGTARGVLCPQGRANPGTVDAAAPPFLDGRADGASSIWQTTKTTVSSGLFAAAISEPGHVGGKAGMNRTAWAPVLLSVAGAWVPGAGQDAARTHQVKLNGHTFTLPAGFDIELAAGPPLVDRPITI